MAWNVEFLDTAKRQLRKLDKRWQSAIQDEELLIAAVTIGHRRDVYE